MFKPPFICRWQKGGLDNLHEYYHRHLQYKREGWFGKRFSAFERGNGILNIHWTELLIYQNAWTQIWDLDTRTTPFRHWPRFIRHRWRYSWPFKQLIRFWGKP